MPRRTRTKRERQRAKRLQEAQERQVRELQRELHEQAQVEQGDDERHQVDDRDQQSGIDNT
jgi:hypothetical protein